MLLCILLFFFFVTFRRPPRSTRTYTLFPYPALFLSEKARILGTELWNTESSLAGVPALRGAWFASVSDGLYRQLATKYRARYGEAPFRLSALGYDAVLLTVRIAQDWKVGTPFPARKLADPEGFSGIDGAFQTGRAPFRERVCPYAYISVVAASLNKENIIQLRTWL